MANILCDKVTEGLRPSEAVVCFRDLRGRTHFIRVEREFLAEQGGRFFLPVGIVHVDPKSRAVLIELPHEAETGANRLWVSHDRLGEPVETCA